MSGFNYGVSNVLVLGIVFVAAVVVIILVFQAMVKSIFSSYFERLKNISSNKTKFTHIDDLSSEITEISTGELRLIGVDERTAAIIIATVSDHLKTPLDELMFKSIKLLN
jgi:hypothetical protein